MEPATDILTYIVAALACIAGPPVIVWLMFNLPDVPEDAGDERAEGDCFPHSVFDQNHDAEVRRE